MKPMRKVHKILSSIGRETREIEEKLRKIFKNEKLKIIDASVIKERKCLALKLRNNIPEKIVLHNFDHPEKFKRAFFVLSELKNLIPVSQFFGKIEKTIIFREYFLAEPFYFLILKKMPFKLLLRKVKEAAQILIRLHDLNLKKLPKFLHNKFGSRHERRYLLETSEAFIPKIAYLKKGWQNNLRRFLKKGEELEKKNQKSLIHGDFHPANIMIRNNNKLLLIDFDIFETGNPAKDLGKFIGHLKEGMEKSGYSFKDIQITINSFLKRYFQKRKINFYPNFEENLNLYIAGMNLHIVKSSIYHLFLKKPKRIKKERIKKIEKLLSEVEGLLS
jgi:thiamine kinase-like enzyme